MVLDTWLSASCTNGGRRDMERFPGFPATLSVVVIEQAKQQSSKKKSKKKRSKTTSTTATTTTSPTIATSLPRPTYRHHCTVLGVCCIVLVEWFLPYSHFITKGYNSWTQGLYGYSWDMMIHTWNTQHVRVTIKAPGREDFFIRPTSFLNSKRMRRYVEGTVCFFGCFGCCGNRLTPLALLISMYFYFLFGCTPTQQHIALHILTC